MKKNKMILGSSILLVVLLVIGGTMAWFTASTDPVTNNFKAGTVKIELIDEFEGAQNVNPGDCYEKIVQVKNTGTKRAYVRVKVEDGFKAIEGEDGETIILDDEGIVIKSYAEGWEYNTDDGYIYYKEVLEPGDTTPSLYEDNQICFAGEAMGNEYQGAEYDIVVEAEAIQVTNGAVEDEWEDSGLTSVVDDNENDDNGTD